MSAIVCPPAPDAAGARRHGCMMKAVMHSLVLYNGRIVSAADKVFSPGQVGLLAGWGVFTTLRIYDGVPFAFERHWARMAKDAKLLHVPLAEDREGVRD